MNIDGIATKAIGGVIAIGLATAILGRSNTAKVINAFGGAMSTMISAALGKGVDIR